MANAFDPYREALVVEQHTIWPEAYEDWSEADKVRRLREGTMGLNGQKGLQLPCVHHQIQFF